MSPAARKDGVPIMSQETRTRSNFMRHPARLGIIVALLLTSASSMMISGCLAAAAAAGAGAGYAVGHEQGEDHVSTGEHVDDD